MGRKFASLPEPFEEANALGLFPYFSRFRPPDSSREEVFFKKLSSSWFLAPEPSP